MQRTSFLSSFRFNTFRFEKSHYFDNRAGAPSHYLGYMRRGHCKILADRYTVEIPEGALFYIPHQLSYQSWWYGNSEICFDSFAFLYFPELEQNDYPAQVIACDSQMLSLVEALTGGWRKPTSRDIGYLYSLLSLALPHMISNPACRAKQIISKAEQFIFANPDAPGSQIAHHCGISESYLYAIFHREGLTPNTLRQRILSEKAVSLLETTDLSIEAISDRLHFSSASYFRKIIKKHTGLTPRQIRQGRQL